MLTVLLRDEGRGLQSTAVGLCPCSIPSGHGNLVIVPLGNDSSSTTAPYGCGGIAKHSALSVLICTTGERR